MGIAAVGPSSENTIGFFTITNARSLWFLLPSLNGVSNDGKRYDKNYHTVDVPYFCHTTVLISEYDTSIV